MLADLLTAHWPAYLAKFGRLIPAEQHAAVRAILRCRTPALGGQFYHCACGQHHFSYHSCNHRACPRCGRDDAALWLERQRTRLLPVPYFLVTLTVPEQLREPIRAAQRQWYAALLRESAGALQDLAAQPKHLGAELGITAMLQTWTRDLRYHPHVHLLVPGGGLTPDGLRWKRVKVAVLPAAGSWRASSRLKTWRGEQPGCQPCPRGGGSYGGGHPGRGPGGGLKYLLIPVQTTAAPPSRTLDAQHVTFRYRENGGAQRHCTVTATEFLRRFLQHVLLRGFQRVRHYGWQGAAAQAKRERIHALLDWRPPALVKPTPVPPPKCPGCGKPMRLIGPLARSPPGG
jgi:hypothetical protein